MKKSMQGIETALLSIGQSFHDHPTAAQDPKGGATTATISKIICFSLAKKFNVYSAKSLEFNLKV